MLRKWLTQFRRKWTAPRVFFSYSRKHSAVVRDFYNFSTIFGGNPFLDERSIPLGSDFPDVIARAIDRSDVFVLMWCVCASESPWVKAELDIAVRKNKRIVPVLLGNFPLPSAIERVNGLKLHVQICVQSSLGMEFGEHLFEDTYARLPDLERRNILAYIENNLRA